MIDLAEFLLARIAEGEAAARQAISERDALIERGATFRGPDDTRAMVWDDWMGGPGIRMGAEALLAECEAKRRIVEAHPLTHNVVPVWTGTTPGVACQNCAALGRNEGDIVEDIGPCDTLLALAAVYSDHPDYREEWR